MSFYIQYKTLCNVLFYINSYVYGLIGKDILWSLNYFNLEQNDISFIWLWAYTLTCTRVKQIAEKLWKWNLDRISLDPNGNIEYSRN